MLVRTECFRSATVTVAAAAVTIGNSTATSVKSGSSPWAGFNLVTSATTNKVVAMISWENANQNPTVTVGGNAPTDASAKISGDTTNGTQSNVQYFYWDPAALPAPGTLSVVVSGLSEGAAVAYALNSAASGAPNRETTVTGTATNAAIGVLTSVPAGAFVATAINVNGNQTLSLAGADATDLTDAGYGGGYGVGFGHNLPAASGDIQHTWSWDASSQRRGAISFEVLAA